MKNRLLSILPVTLILFNSCSSDSIEDENGNSYQTVKIGEQIWTTTNLSTTTFRNGDNIMQATNGEEWKWSINNSEPAWCYHDFDNYKETYGKIYNFYAVSDNRGLAPEGWRVPDDKDWNLLIEFLAEGVPQDTPGKWNKNSGVSHKLKKGGIKKWSDSPNYEYNESGFTGIPMGYLYGAYGKFCEEDVASWWSSSQNSSGLMANDAPFSRYRLSGNRRLDQTHVWKWEGHYVRCLKNN